MKEYKILKGSKEPKKTSCYELEIEFMTGDADGYNFRNIFFGEDKLTDVKFKEELSDFIDSVEMCIELDSNGRCGFSDERQLVNWYKDGKDRYGSDYNIYNLNWSRFCNSICERDEYEDLTLPLETDSDIFVYDIPCEDDYYDSYERLTMYYYDKNGDKFEVEIINN